VLVGLQQAIDGALVLPPRPLGGSYPLGILSHEAQVDHSGEPTGAGQAGPEPFSAGSETYDRVVRLFVAVWPPEPVVEAIRRLPRPPLIGARWTREEQWHVTLRFLGELADPRAAAEALARVPAMEDRVVAEAGPAVACLGRRVLCVPVAGLESLASAVIKATAKVGRRPERRAFVGHVTLARSPRGGWRTGDVAGVEGVPFRARWEVEELTLVASIPEGGAHRYESVARQPLR
jgi:2'-5' RNA ligase